MRILLIGPHWDTGRWTEYCTVGLTANGHKVHTLVYSSELSRSVGLLGRVHRRLVGSDRFHLGRVLDAQRRDNLQAVKLAQRHKPDLVVVLKGEVFLPETIDRIRTVAAGPVVQWCGDDPTWFPNITAAAHLYKRFFLAEPSYSADLTRYGVQAEFLPHAADPTAWSAGVVDPQIPSFDVVFVGDSRHNMGHLPASRERVELVEAVAQAGVSLGLWGRGWEKLEERYSARRHHCGLTLLPASRVAAVYRAAKVVLNIHHAQMREGVNMRTFEIPAAGAFQLSDYKTRMDKLFRIDHEIAIFRDRDELIDRVHSHLADAKGRRAIADAGRERVLRDHTYTVRMRQLVERAVGRI